MTIPESDQILLADLQKVLDELDRQRRILYTRRSGCTCYPEHLCAHHAAVWNHLRSASDDILRAIRQIQYAE